MPPKRERFDPYTNEWFVEAHRRFDTFVERAFVAKPKNGREDIGNCLVSTVCVRRDKYVNVVIFEHSILLHRLSLILHTGEIREGMEAAHECNNQTCFEPSHLSWKTPKENQQDKYIDGTHDRGKKKQGVYISQFVCVSKDKRHNKWYAFIRMNGKSKHLGSFPTELAAAEAYDAEARRINATIENPNAHFRLNFP